MEILSCVLYTARVLGMAALMFAPSFRYFLARERHFYTLFKLFLGRGSRAWEWGLIHQKARVKLRSGVPLGTARTRFCMRENHKVVSDTRNTYLIFHVVCTPPN